MPTVKRFEELDVWKLARLQCRAFAQLVSEGFLRNTGPLLDQMDRSSASVMDNIAEGFDRFSKADFRHFLVIARGSNAEFRSQLYRAADRGLIRSDTFEEMFIASENLGVKLHHFISYLTKAEFKNKPEAKDLSSDPGGLQEQEVLYEAMREHDVPLEFLVHCPVYSPNSTSPSLRSGQK